MPEQGADPLPFQVSASRPVYLGAKTDQVWFGQMTENEFCEQVSRVLCLSYIEPASLKSIQKYRQTD